MTVHQSGAGLIEPDKFDKDAVAPQDVHQRANGRHIPQMGIAKVNMNPLCPVARIEIVGKVSALAKKIWPETV